MKQNRLRPVTRKNLTTFAIVIVAFAVMQILSGTGVMSNSLQGQLVPICTYIIMAVSLNLTVGILGELSLGHAGFVCIGAYAGSIFAVGMQDVLTSAWVRFPLALLVGGIAAAVFGILIGLPVLRLRGDYLAIVTLAFGEIIRNILGILVVGKDSAGFHVAVGQSTAMELQPDGYKIIDGPMGIKGTPNDATFIAGFILVLITLFVITSMMDSRAGRAVMAIRDNRIAAESVGISITKYKLLVFAVSAFFAGIAGVLYSHNFSSLPPSKFDYNLSIMILVMVVLGGMGSMRGSVIAAVLLTALPEMLRGLQDYRMLIYSIILIAAMILNNNEKVKTALNRVTAKFKRQAKPAGEVAQ